MTAIISHTLLEEFSDFITQELGLYFPRERWMDLEKGLHAAAKVFKFDDEESCVHWLMSSPLNQTQCEILASYLTVGETYFFRDMNIFKILEDNILPSLIHLRYRNRQQYLRLWSAGCASGEEPYSLAIILYKLIPNISSWNLTLLSTDINTDSLKKLKKGIYTEWSFRGVPNDIRNTYFNKNNNNEYEILSDIKNLTDARYLNLAKCHYPNLETNTNAMDIIICRNVLMYFTPEIAEKIVNHLYDCLVDDGILIVSPVEAPQPYFNRFELLPYNGLPIFKKSELKIKTETEFNFNSHDEELVYDEIEDAAINEEDVNYYEITNELANKGQLLNALSWNDKAIVKNKADAENYYLRAMIMIEMGKQDEAINALNKVIYINPEYVLAYIVLGNLLKKTNKVNEAKKNFEYALSILKNKDPVDMIGDISVGRLIDVIRNM